MTTRRAPTRSRDRSPLPITALCTQTQPTLFSALQLLTRLAAALRLNSLSLDWALGQWTVGTGECGEAQGGHSTQFSLLPLAV